MSSQQKPQGRVVDLDKMPESFKAGLTRDPATGMKGMPPNLGRDVLPHVSTVQSYYGTQSKVYRPSDEALKHSTENSRFMRNDCAVMECLESRQRGTALLNWHLAPEREDSPEQQALADEVTRILERTPRFTEYRRTLLDALWYGRHAIANVYKKDRVGGQWRTVVGDWQPRNGDKLVFRYDDGQHRYREGQVGIRVGAGISDQDKRRVVAEGLEESKVEATGNGLAYFLDDWERRLMVLHHHMVEDGAYEDPEGQGAVFGVGIRSRIYWTWYQSQEVLAHLLEYLERSAFGIEIWKYPAGNATAESQTRKAAEQRIGGGRSIVLVPVATGEDPGLYLPEHIEPGLGGVDACFRMVQEFYNHRIKRYILGQVLTSEAEATGLGSGVADAHLATYADIVRYDAVNLSESLTTDLVRPVQLWNFPGSEHIRLQLVIDTTSPDADAQIEAAKTMHEMGVPLKTDEVRSLGGFTKPEEGDDVLQKQEEENPLAALMGGGGGGLGGQQVDPGQGAEQYAKAGWKEEDHPRDADGKFGEGGGKSSSSSPAEDYKINGVKSKAFKSWFGDWESGEGSRVVDSNGEPEEQHNIPDSTRQPRTVFHGTAKGGWDAFDKDKLANPESLLYGPGFYFTEDEEIATAYTRKGADGDDGAEVKEVFLNIRQPYNIDTPPPVSEWPKKYQDEMLANAEKDAKASIADATELREAVEQARKDTPDDFAPGGEWFGADVDYLKDADQKEKWGEEKLAAIRERDVAKALSHVKPPTYSDLVFDHGSKQKANDWLQSIGFDGMTHTGGDIMGGGKHHRVWIAFEPNQIKSTDNQGTFDPSDDRMAYTKRRGKGKYEKIWRTIGEGKGTKIQLDSKTGEVLKGGPPELRGKNIRDAKQIFDDLNSKRKFNNANDSLKGSFEGGTFEGEMQTRGRGNPKFREDSDPFAGIDWEEEDHSQPLPEDAEQDQLMDNLRAMSDYKPQRRPPKPGSPLDKALDAVGDNPTHRAILRDAIEDAHKLAQSEARDHNEAIDGVLSAVIKQPKHRGAFLRQITKVEDPSTVQGFDKMVDAAEKYYPQILAGYQGESVGEGDTEYALLNVLQEGKRQIPAKHHPDVVGTAMSWLSQAPAEVDDTEEEWEPFSRRGYAEKYRRKYAKRRRDKPGERWITVGDNNSKIRIDGAGNITAGPDWVAKDGIKNVKDFGKKEDTEKKPPVSPLGSNFDRWFRDSKIVDEEGQPTKVVHGTTSDFNAFDPDHLGRSTDEGELGEGFYFSTDPSIVREHRGEKAIEANLRIENPLRVSIPRWEADKRNAVGELLGMSKEDATAPGYGKRIAEALKAAGHDGVVLDYSNLGYPHQEMMVLTPNQIKSTDNNGNFDPDDDRMAYAKHRGGRR